LNLKSDIWSLDYIELKIGKAAVVRAQPRTTRTSGVHSRHLPLTTDTYP